MNAKATDRPLDHLDSEQTELGSHDSDAVDVLREDDDRLDSLRSELQELRQQVLHTDERIANYLAHRDCEETRGSALAADPQRILSKMDELAIRIENLHRVTERLVEHEPVKAAEDPHSQMAGELGTELKESQLRIGKSIAKLVRDGFDQQRFEFEQQFKDLRDSIAQLSLDVLPQSAEDFEISDEAVSMDNAVPMDGADSPGDASPWTDVIFGADLASEPELSGAIGELRDRLLAGDPTAVSLAGHLMVFHSALPERRPQLLKELGEAYYRCCPKRTDEDNVLETALVESLQGSCQGAGYSNTIELVHPGERFDSTRHSPVGKGGVEVAGACGWVVLRDDGKVYTKASVTLR